MTFGWYEGEKGRIYALFRDRSRAQNRLYYCDIKTGLYPTVRWNELTPMPPEADPADTGTNIAYCFIPASDEHLIFVVLGVRSKQFWKYDILSNTWKRLEDVPDLVCYGALEIGGYTEWQGYPCVGIYLLQGNWTNVNNKFWRYHYCITPRAQSPISWWEDLSPTPHQYYPEFTYSPQENAFYVVLDAPYGFFQKYDIQTKKWNTLRDSPTIGQWEALATLGVIGTGTIPGSSGETLYYLKGHMERDFYHYLRSRNAWSASSDDPPLKVGCGSDLAFGKWWMPVNLEYNGMWAFFGNNTDSFGFFNPYINVEEGEGGGQTNSSNLLETSLLILQNPSGKYVRFKTPTTFWLEIYDNLGNLLSKTFFQEEGIWNYKKVSPGVYFYLIKTKGFSRSGKIIIAN